ncbi:Uncharacterised protein [Mycobacteroides abscessus subsp. abscessus]|nr:Uncharacterised protein [Mycobacteroides abscessus subsp. abscessus]
MAVARFDQVWQECLGAVCHTPEVDIHQPVEVIPFHVLDIGRKCHPGIVEHQIDLPELILDVGGMGIDGGAIGHVELEGDGGRARLLAAPGGIGHPGGIDVRKCQARTTLRQRQRQAAADT